MGMFGGHIKNFTAEVGMGDVRDGLSLSAKAEAAMSLHATGHSVCELHRSIRCDTIGLREALHTAKKTMASARDHIAQTLNISQERVDDILDGQADANTTRPPMTLQVEVEGGVGIEGCVCLGWKDTQGYRMVGMAAKAEAAVLPISGKMFVGRHKTGKSAKIIIGLAGFSLQYTFPIGQHEVTGSTPSVAEVETCVGTLDVSDGPDEQDCMYIPTRSSMAVPTRSAMPNAAAAEGSQYPQSS